MKRNYFGSALALAALLSAPLPAVAQNANILEQMQDEVAHLVKNAKGAIVSIEDRRVIVQQIPVWVNDPTPQVKEAANKAKVAELEKLQADKNALDEKITDLTFKFTDINPQVKIAKAQREDLKQKIAELRKEVDPEAAQANEQKTARDRLTSLAEQKAKQESLIANLRTRYVNTNPRVKEAEQSLESINNQLAQAEREVARTQNGGGFPDASKRFFVGGRMIMRAQRQVRITSGSGFSIGEGYVLTSADVADGMQNPVIITDSGNRLQAKLVGVDMDWNVGLLKLTGNDVLPSLPLGDSSSLAAGHFAISIGNQAGQANSVALSLIAGIRDEGMVSGLHFYPSLIQIAGTVGAGVSGAPVLDAKGEVIAIMAATQGEFAQQQFNFGGGGGFPGAGGFNAPVALPAAGDPLGGVPPAPPAPLPNVAPANPAQPRRQNANSALPAAANARGRILQADAAAPVQIQAAPQIFRQQVGSAGFAIPINDIKPVIAALKSGKPIVHVWLGVNLQEDTTQIANADGSTTTERNVILSGVYPNSPAAAAGLQPGDILVSLNGRPARSINAVKTAIARQRSEASVAAVIKRDDKEQTITLKIAPRPAIFGDPITIRVPGGQLRP